MTIKLPPIPEPNHSSESLRQTAIALKEAVEVLSAQRGSMANAVVTWQDLVDLGVILPTQIPKK